MLLKNNKGSILIMSIIIFSIISLICITCSSLILSNNRIYELEYKTEKLKEMNLGVIELIYSNILKEVKFALENTTTESEFYDYLTKNNSNIFINKIKRIENTNLENSIIDMSYNINLSTKEYIHYKISTRSKLDIYDKYAFISVKIKNPFFEKTQQAINLANLQEEQQNVNLSEIKEYELITFYNYEEK